MQIVTVNVNNHPYPIYIGQGLLSNLALFQPHIADDQIVIISDEIVFAIFEHHFIQFQEAFQVDPIVIKAGEKHKTLDELNPIFHRMIKNKHRRSTTVISLGGGVTTDIAGFVASCYMRGVNLIHIPTTLLAQVDASLGGKTGINNEVSKNIIGTIYQPNAVMIDIDTLMTLPHREYRSAIAEVIKYGLINDASFFDWIEKNIEVILSRQKDAILFMISRSCTIKAKYIERDERDQGSRGLLNLGHTFGHALESLTCYKEMMHGEAVAMGIYWASIISQKLGWLNTKDVERIKILLNQFGLTLELKFNLNLEQIIEQLKFDKKNQGKGLRLVLLEKIGQAKLVDAIEPKTLYDCLSELQIKGEGYVSRN